MKPLDIAIIGCGFFGQQLAAGFHKAGAKILAVTDIDPQRAEKLAADYHADSFKHGMDLLQHSQPDLAVIATPNYAHYSPALSALNANCHLFIDTPFALNSAHCRYIVELAEKQQKSVFIGHLLRTLPGIKRVKQWLEQERLGKVTVARATRQRWIEYSPHKEWWKLDSNLTGGELFHQIHELDLLCWLLGDIHYVYAHATNQVHAAMPDSQDVIQLLFQFKNGISGSLEMGTAYRLHDWGIILHGTEGAIHINFYTSSVTFTQPNGKAEHFHLYDEFEADLSLRESAKGIQKYNDTDGICPFWLSRAVEIEAESIVNHLCHGIASPLPDTLSQAIQVAEAAKHSMITEKRIYLNQ